MTSLRATVAPIYGIWICLTNRKLRKLCVKPWIIGVCCQIVTIPGAFYLYRFLLNLMSLPTETTLQIAWFGFVSIFLFLGSMCCSLFIAIALTMILAGIYQTKIAEIALIQFGAPIKANQEAPSLRLTLRYAWEELARLLWLVPFSLFMLLFAFVPILAPVLILLSSWLIAFQFADIVLDACKYTSKQRLSWATSKFLPMSLFGLSATVLIAIPILGFFVAPFVTAGMAYFVASNTHTSLKNDI